MIGSRTCDVCGALLLYGGCRDWCTKTKPEERGVERTPEKEAEVLRRLESKLSAYPEAGNLNEFILNTIEAIRERIYRPKPREVWVFAKPSGYLERWSTLEMPKADSASGKWIKFREVIETDS